MSANRQSDTAALKNRAAFISFIVSFLLASGKLFAATISGSLGMLSEAIQTILDVFATAVTWLTVRISDKPADANHPWGHGKFESVTAFAQCGMLLGVAVWIIAEAAQRFLHPSAEIMLSPLVIGILLGSIAIDFWRSRALKRVAKQTGSQALEADALHFSTDMFSSGIVLAGLFASVMGYPWADSLAAIGVACFILYAAWSLGRRAFDVLVDAAPQNVTQDIFEQASRVSGVLSIDNVRVRSLGAAYAIDLHVSVDRALPLETVAQIQREIESAVIRIYPESQIVVNPTPVVPSDESLATRVRTLAAHQHRAIHNITIHHSDGRIFIGVDMELEAELSLVDAHIVASQFESYVSHDLGAHVDVETHIEPLNPERQNAYRANQTLHTLLQAELMQYADELGNIVQEIHNVRVRNCDEGILVHFHARLDPAMSVRDAHQAIDAVERKLRQANKRIVRVVGHAEPLKMHVN